ncbi:32007_t:CDS:2 [Gigaspora margarita]|uniref:32007_t:CDS:1 n=1 Tax=Gigaspora margarita TaxID=4874 RepID=A0ABN7VFV5_GIGMA|nr:32007_t:CDS:2 [Gigaspora margarita]
MAQRLLASIENILLLMHESSYNGIKNNRYSEIENDNDLRFENDIEDELEDESGIEREKDTEDRPGIEFEENIDIISESDDASKSTDNYQCEHLPPICIEIYCEKIFGIWKECQETLEQTNRLQDVFYMNPEQCELWRCYTDIILNDNIAVTNIYKLLLSIFAIQTIEAIGVQSGAFMIDADPGLKRVVSKIYSNIYLLHCIWHIGYNIKKQLAKLLGDHYTDFIKAFYHARNVLCKKTFKKYWKQLMIDFSKSTEYLLRQLDTRKTTWAKAFTGRVFTAEITFTQQSESINEEQFADRLATWHEKSLTYMIPSLHIDQMNETVMYYSKRVNFENLYNLTLEVVDNGLIEFEYDSRQICFDELLEGVDYSLIAKVWEFQSIEHKSNIGYNSEKAYFYISLIPKCWYKDEFMDTVVVNELFFRRKSLEKNSLIPSLPFFSDVADSWNIMLIEAPVQTVAKAIDRKQSIKGTLLGLARKCIEEAQCNKQIIEQELEDNQNIESNQNTESDQETESDQDTKNDQNIETIQLDIQNPFKYIEKGHPSKKHIKSAIEKPKKHTHTSSHTYRQCSICKNKKHDK